ncbi:MAG: FtsX-like permease family protein [Erysipelotrichaceae bacterium]
MKHTLLKDTFCEIKTSLGRFFSIFAIVAIGVAFFAGVKASAPDMKSTADHYYDQYNLMDLHLISTVGFTQDDVDAIRKVDKVSGVDAGYSMDALTQVGTRQFTLKVLALPIDNLSKDNPDYINQANLVEGRLPENSGECLIEKGKAGDHFNLKIGDTLTLHSGNDDPIDKSLKINEFRIVGTTQTPYYLSYEKGSSLIGSGKISNFIMIPKQDFNMEYYTEIDVSIKGADALNSYNDEYFDVVDPVTKAVKELAKERVKIRKGELLEVAQKEIDKNRSLLSENRKKYEDGIKEGQRKLDDANALLISSANTIQSNRNDLALGEKKLQDAQITLDNSQAELNRNKADFNSKLAGLAAQRADLQDKLNQATNGLAQAKAGLAQVTQALSNPMLPQDQKDALLVQKASLEQTITTLSGQIAQLQGGIASIDQGIASGKQALSDGQNKIDAGQNELNNQRIAFIQTKKDALIKLQEGEAKLASGKVDYEKGVADLQREKIKGAEELQNAEEKINKAEKNISKKINPKWYALDRHKHYSYMDYGGVANRMDAIAKIFPVFFFLVAALVCLTTMTRMVDEQRGTIGTFKALGYSKLAIAFKYIVYALSASLTGGLVGSVIGMIVFPLVIAGAWGIMYAVPALEITMHWDLAFVAIGLASAFTTIAAGAAVYADLIVTPALLMRPKAPKNGKKIFLEKIPMIWKHFSFTQKVTARNIFRYKKRFLMTVIGISGCTALLLAGFGIRDSISQVANIQFKEIFKHDMILSFEPKSTMAERDEFTRKLEKDNRFSSLMEVAQYNGLVNDGKEDKSVIIYSPKDNEEFYKFVNLRKRVGHEAVKLKEHGAIITEKLASDCGVDIGDKLAINSGDGVKSNVLITGIVENYVEHYVYMSDEAFKESFEITPKCNTIMALLKNGSESIENQLGTYLIDFDEVNSVTFYQALFKNFNDMISSLGFVTFVLVISAGLLAFVVLYNLSTVNVSERLREIATIKVLGFYDKEVSSYVYRESIFLTLIGSFTGCGLGIFLHRIIMNLAELDNVMFGRNIEGLSFIYSIVITMVFAIIVNVVMHHTLKKIPMVESLKSVE